MLCSDLARLLERRGTWVRVNRERVGIAEVEAILLNQWNGDLEEPQRGVDGEVTRSSNAEAFHLPMLKRTTAGIDDSQGRDEHIQRMSVDKAGLVVESTINKWYG